MIRRPPRSTLSSSSAASDVYKRQSLGFGQLRRTGQNEAQTVTNIGDERLDRGGSFMRDGQQDLLLSGMAGHAPHRAEQLGAARDGFQPGLRMSQPHIPACL